MTYTKTTWSDRAVQYPSRFTTVTNADGSITLTPSPGTITNSGTPITATALNNLETQYDQAVAYSLGLVHLQENQFDNTATPDKFPLGISSMSVSTASSLFPTQYGTLITSYTGNINRATQQFIDKNTSQIYVRTADNTQTNGWLPWQRQTNLNDFTASRATNGYQYLPGGMIFQWGTVALPTTLTANTQQYVDCMFPISFPSNVYMVTHDLSGQDTNGNTLNLGHRQPAFTLSKSSIRVENFSPLALASGQIMFFAVGK